MSWKIFLLICLQVVFLTSCMAFLPFTKNKQLVGWLVAKSKVFENDSFVPEAEKEIIHWQNVGLAELRQSLQKQTLNLNEAKNVIFFLGDGMSASTVTAARILQGQKKNKKGEEGLLSFEEFTYTGLSKTYCANAQVAESACSSTAYLGGVKANLLTIGVTANVKFNDCAASMDTKNHVSSILAFAQKAGKSTGFITTTKLTHASPAGTYAHTANRLYECDADVKLFGKDPETCMDIAKQLIMEDTGKNFDIMMGGGMSKFTPENMTDAHGNQGERIDGIDLLKKWEELHPDGRVVTNLADLKNLDLEKVKKIMGVFASQKMDYHLKAKSQQPTLTDMTETAIKLMSRNPKGYFLFVEGGLIDVAHHKNQAGLALDETLEMAEAIEHARKITSELNTLIVTTADHSQPMTITGFPARGSDILGLDNEFSEPAQQKSFTLNYVRGAQQYLDEHGKPLNLEKKTINEDFEYPSQIPSQLGIHSGEDVNIYASGPHAHLFNGVFEESSIPYVIGYAACLGDGDTLCKQQSSKGWLSYLNPLSWYKKD